MLLEVGVLLYNSTATVVSHGFLLFSALVARLLFVYISLGKLLKEAPKGTLTGTEPYKEP